MQLSSKLFGALTSKPYAFTARPWEIKTVETIDVCDSIGSNIKINFKETEVLRILPSVNDSLNEEWLSDKARFCIDALKTERITSPFIKQANKLVAFNWESKEFAEAYKSSIFNFNSLNKTLEEGYKKRIVRPDRELVFNAYNFTKVDQVKAIILGQDPYHNDNQVGKIPDINDI